LWWVRHARPLSVLTKEEQQQPPKRIEKEEQQEPPMSFDEPPASVEVLFHRVQSWMFGTSPRRPQDAAAAKAETGAAASRMPVAVQRGASHLLESILAAIRRVLLDELGIGNLLIDGGGRVRFRCELSPDQRRCLDRILRETVDGLFRPSGTVGRRFAGVLRNLAAQGHFGERPEDERHLVQLAWESIPPLSVTFQAGPAPDGADGRVPPLRRYWKTSSFPPLSPAQSKRDAFLRPERQMSLPMRVRMEIGVLAPRERLLGVRFARGPDVREGAELPSGTDRFEQLLLVDLNRVGDLFGRCREPRPLDGEAVMRRSLRFAAHWLLAITRTATELEHPSMPEVLVLGGDDLLVGTRLPTGELLPFATRLHEHLGRLNGELPACDGISFCAGLLRRAGSRRSSKELLEDVIRLERTGKERWQREVLSTPASVPSAGDDGLVVNRIGAGRRMSLIVTGSTGSVSALAAGDPAEADTIIECAPLDIRLAGDDFRLSAPAGERIAADANAAARAAGNDTPRLELLVEEDTQQVFLISRAPRPAKLSLPTADTPPEPCCVAPPRGRGSSQS